MEVNSSAPAAKARKQREDENPTGSIRSLNDFPAKVLEHIVSFLPTKNAVGTSILSKKWRDLWKSLCNLEFSFTESDAAFLRNAFMNFVTGVLLLRDDSSNIKRFSLTCDLPPNAYLITTWVSTVVRQQVEELILHLDYIERPFEGFDQEEVVLPSCLFTSESLRYLVLDMNHELKLPCRIQLSNLKTLTLFRVEFLDGERTQKLFSNCSLLEDLTLDCCNWKNIKAVCISSPRLKKVSICDSLFIQTRKPRIYNKCGHDDHDEESARQDSMNQDDDGADESASQNSVNVLDEDADNESASQNTVNVLDEDADNVSASQNSMNDHHQDDDPVNQENSANDLYAQDGEGIEQNNPMSHDKSGDGDADQNGDNEAAGQKSMHGNDQDNNPIDHYGNDQDNNPIDQDNSVNDLDAQESKDSHQNKIIDHDQGGNPADQNSLNGCQVMIFGPSLQNFNYRGRFKNDFCLYESSSLVCATLAVDRGGREAAFRAHKLLRELCSSESLTIVAETLELLDAAGVFFPNLPLFYNLNHLKLNVGPFHCAPRPGLLRILQISPNLNHLEISWVIPLGRTFSEDAWAFDPVPPCLLTQIKTIDILSYSGHEQEFHVVKQLLKMATALERMRFGFKELCSSQNMETYNELKELPRGSMNCEIGLL